MTPQSITPWVFEKDLTDLKSSGKNFESDTICSRFLYEDKKYSVSTVHWIYSAKIFLGVIFTKEKTHCIYCLLYTSPSPRD